MSEFVTERNESAAEGHGIELTGDDEHLLNASPTEVERRGTGIMFGVSEGRSLLRSQRNIILAILKR